MDVGNTNRWSLASSCSRRAKSSARIGAIWPLEPVEACHRGEVATRYRYADGRGEVGIVSSVTEPFCRDRHRARLSADGKLFTCLFAAAGTDLVLGLVRSGAEDAAIRAFLAGTWERRNDRYSEERAGVLAAGRHPEKIEMSYIGG